MASVSDWHPPDRWRKITSIDAHTAGEPLRVVVDGYPPLEGKTMIERRRFAQEHFDDLRTALMCEPRGHAEMYGCIVTEPVSPAADFGVLFMHNEGYSTMCGHGIIGVATMAVETGMVAPNEPETVLRIDTPAGIVTAYAKVSKGKVKGVRFRNVPSFVYAMNQTVEVSLLGAIKYDIAFGGAFYAFVSAEDVGLRCVKEEYGSLIDKGMAIKHAVMSSKTITHPFEKDLGFLYGTIFTGRPHENGSHSRHVCIFANGQVDRSPTGTGVSARLALLHLRKELGVNQPAVFESIIGTTFTGRVVETTTYGDYQAVIPEVEGQASIIGRHEFLIDPDDPLKNGFLLSHAQTGVNAMAPDSKHELHSR